MIALPGGLVAAGIGILLVGTTARADAYFQLHYDYEVATHCGRVSPEVERAFRVKRADADDTSHMDVSTRKALRIRAYAEAAREYDNRGLGGHRAWCDTDGAVGVRRILGTENK